jgi:hypothetical protein
VRRILAILALIAMAPTASSAQNGGYLLINNDNVNGNSADIDTISSTGALALLATVQTGGTGIGGWPTQARLWLEWGSSTAAHNRPAARSRFRAVHSDSISTRPSHPVA